MSIRVNFETALFYLFHKGRLSLVGKNRICAGTVLSCNSVKLDYGARINGPAYFRGTGDVYIGRYAAIGQALRVLTSNHEASGINTNVFLQRKIGAKSNQGEGRTVSIGPATWIGDGVTIIGVNIGVGAIVGAGSVVTRHVEPFTVVAGNPAKVIKARFQEDTMNKVLNSKWWECSVEDLKPAKAFFEKDASDLDEDELKCLKNLRHC